MHVFLCANRMQSYPYPYPYVTAADTQHMYLILTSLSPSIVSTQPPPPFLLSTCTTKISL